MVASKHTPGVIPLYFAMGVDPVASAVLTLAIDPDRETCRTLAEFRRGEDVVYLRVFLATAREFPTRLHDWLLECGLPDSDAVSVIRHLGSDLQKVVESEISRGDDS